MCIGMTLWFSAGSIVSLIPLMVDVYFILNYSFSEETDFRGVGYRVQLFNTAV